MSKPKYLRYLCIGAEYGLIHNIYGRCEAVFGVYVWGGEGKASILECVVLVYVDTTATHR